MFDKMTTPGKPEISEDNENDDVSEEEETESGGDENAQEIAKDPTSRHPIQVSSGEDCIVLKFDHEIVCVQPVQICAVDESSCMNGNDLSHEHKVVEKMSQTNSSPMVVHRRGADGAVGPNCIILAISLANQDIATSDAFRIAREVDPTGGRSVSIALQVLIMDHLASKMGSEYLAKLLSKEGEIQREQTDITFEDPQKARSNGLHLVYQKPNSEKKGGLANKNRPMEVTAKKPMSRFREVIQVPKRENWRRPKGIDSSVRRKFKGCTLMPNIGYGSNKKTRHYLPNGFKKFLVRMSRSWKS
ncbi:hypothetical protein U1Q18_015033 [Sarracenia purpurea var. burkii]